MLIVVEGPDGAGKTTFVEKVRDRLEDEYWTIYHHGVPIRHPLLEYEVDHQWYRPGGDVHLLMDRLHIGERVYGEMYRGASALGDTGMMHIDLFLMSRGAVLVHLDQETDELRRRCEVRGESYLNLDDLEEVRARYRWALDDCLIERVELIDPDDWEIEGVLRVARERDVAAEKLIPFSTYVGQPNPSVLLLGEKRSGVGAEAAFLPMAATSGRYLLNAINDALNGNAHFIRMIGIANALEEDLPSLVETLNNPKVVALGRAASEACDAAQIQHGAVPHPQFIRRFHYGKRPEYGHLLFHTAFDQERRPTWPL